jgi:flagellar basal body-associated protein FliL
MQHNDIQDTAVRRQNRRLLIVLIVIFVVLTIVAMARMLWRTGA